MDVEKIVRDCNNCTRKLFSGDLVVPCITCVDEWGLRSDDNDQKETVKLALAKTPVRHIVLFKEY